MKTAVSIPDGLFREVERIAKKTGMNRSQLYALALKEYVERQKRGDVTAQLDRVYEGEIERDTTAQRAALSDLPEERC